MEFSTIILSGELCRFDELAARGEGLLSDLFVYQNLHVESGKPLFLERHLELLQQQYKAVFHKENSPLQEDKIEEQIQTLLRENKCQGGDYHLRIYLWEQSYMIAVSESLLYGGFTLWHTRFEAEILDCENPLSGISSSLSLSLAKFSLREKDKVLLNQNLDKIITGVGDMPVFFIKQGKVYTTPVRYGACQSIERANTIEAIKKAGLLLEQKPCLSKQMEEWDEIFFANTQGIVSVKSYQETLYHLSHTERISKYLTEIN